MVNNLFILIGNILYVGVLIYYLRKEIVKDFKDFRKGFSKLFNTSLKYWLAGLGLMIISNGFIVFYIADKIPENEAIVREAISSFPIITLFSTILLAPFIEEIIFRKTLSKIFQKKWLYVGISTLIFGGLHTLISAESYQELLFFFPYAFLGGAFALLYYKTKNIFCTISVHFIHNAMLSLAILAAL